MAQLIKFFAGVTLLMMVMALVSADQYDEVKKLCTEQEVENAFHLACQIPPRGKRDVQVDVEDEAAPAIFKRTKRNPAFEGAAKAEMVTKCCNTGCSVREFQKFRCY